MPDGEAIWGIYEGSNYTLVSEVTDTERKADTKCTQTLCKNSSLSKLHPSLHMHSETRGFASVASIGLQASVRTLSKSIQVNMQNTAKRWDYAVD